MRILRIHSIPALTLFLLALTSIAVSGASAVEHIPPRINFQGRFLDTQGKPLDGLHNLTFRMYDAEAGGNLLWSEDHSDVSFHSGLVDIVLGSVSPITPDIVTPPILPTESFFDVFIEVTVDGETLAPRTLLTSHPYALVTSRIDGDITTSPGDMLIEDQVGLNYQKIHWTTSGGEGRAEMESSDGLGITKVYDKATPLLYEFHSESGQGAEITKRTDQSSPQLYQSTVESEDGVGITKVYDKATPLLYEFHSESGQGAEITKRTDQSSPQLYQSTVESGDGVGITKVYDKATPLLFEFHSESGQGAEITKRTDQSSPQLYQSTVESGDGVGITKVYDKATPLLYEFHSESGQGAEITKRTDQSSPQLYQSTVESGDGVGITKVYDKATPLLYQSLAMKKSIGGLDSLVMTGLIESDTIWFGCSASEGTASASKMDKASPRLMEAFMESGEGPSVSKHVDKATPQLFQSMTESTDGVTIAKVYDRASPKLAMLGAHYMNIEDADIGDSAIITMTADSGGVAMKQAIQDGDAALQAQLEAITLPTEEISLKMISSSGGLPNEEICLSTGPGSDPVGMWMFSTGNLSPGEEAPADTNFQVHTTAEGGTLAMENVGGTGGDGVLITVADGNNSLRLRHGGANTGVYFETDPSTGGRIGINTEAPSEALQVSGNICATGTIGVCSDVRFKEDIQDIPDALEKIAALRGVNFSWRRDQYPAQRFASGRQVGFVAQEVVEVLPEVVVRNDNGYYAIDYGKLTPLLVEAVKELTAENEELRRRIEALEQTVR